MISNIRKILNQAGSYRPKYIRGLVYNTIKSFFISLMIVALFYIFTHLENLKPNHILTSLAILLLSVAGRYVFQYLTDLTLGQASYDSYRDKRLKCGDLLKKAPMGFFTEARLGKIQALLVNTMADLESRSTMTLTFLLGGMTQAVFMSIFLLVFNPIVGFIALITIGLGLIAIDIIGKLAKAYNGPAMEASDEMLDASLEYILGIATNRLYRRDSDPANRLNKAMEAKRDIDTQVSKKTDWIMKVYEAIYKFGACAILLASLKLYQDGQISLPYALTFMASSFLIFSELEMMGNGAYMSQQLAMKLDRLEALFNIPQMDQAKEDYEFHSLDIELKNVDFSYDEQGLLKGINLKIPEGSSCALVGPSGSGKTSLCRLIARFWDPKSGQVLIGGQDISQVSLKSVFEKISIVFQNVYLFEDTVANNIAFGQPQTSMDQIIQASKRAQCHDFIMDLPQGYDTLVGEGGAKLSGGEKQRISIARALLKDAPIIILDEATASLDPENEYAVLKALDELAKDRTVISIAHRLSTVKNADQIIVLDKGTVVQRGRHEDLIKEEGLYQSYVKLAEKNLAWQLGREQ